MTEDPFAAPVRRRAQRLLATGPFGDELVYVSGKVAQPVPVVDPRGQLHSWFVPVTVGDKLASFMELMPDLTLARYSSFQREARTLTGCPDADLWLNEQAIRRRAHSKTHPGEQVGAVVLTFDGEPARLAWAVTVTDRAGKTRTIYVRVDTVSESESPEETTTKRKQT